jgi:2-C-methyl-D-erythritol 2,4-cyclodiphosphate synthase
MLGQHPIQTIHREALLDNASHNPDDSQAPANLLNALRSVRIGIGHDTHRLKPGGPLRLGGIDIAHEFSLDGHSDADVLLHAVTDAILGAAAIGDIGELFPDNLAENKGRDSADMLQLAMERVTQAGFCVINLDCIVFAQKPKLSSYKPTIAKRIAEILDIEADQVGVKAKTGEGVGAVGKNEIMMAQCVALLAKTT